MYKVTADAATLVPCDPALDQGGYPAQSGQIIPSIDREFRVATEHLLLLSLLIQYLFLVLLVAVPFC